jgi:hypothetical protein
MWPGVIFGLRFLSRSTSDPPVTPCPVTHVRILDVLEDAVSTRISMLKMASVLYLIRDTYQAYS